MKVLCKPVSRALAQATPSRSNRRPLLVSAVTQAPVLPAPAPTLEDHLKESLSGLSASTRRIRVSNTSVLGCSAQIVDRPATQSQRCSNLDIHIGFEASPKTATAEPIKGTARVSLSSVDEGYGARDMVKVAVDLDSLHAPPDVKADVVYAVQGLDSIIMDKLNQFLWDVEKMSLSPSSASHAAAAAV